MVYQHSHVYIQHHLPVQIMTEAMCNTANVLFFTLGVMIGTATFAVWYIKLAGLYGTILRRICMLLWGHTFLFSTGHWDGSLLGNCDAFLHQSVILTCSVLVVAISMVVSSGKISPALLLDLFLARSINSFPIFLISFYCCLSVFLVGGGSGENIFQFWEMKGEQVSNGQETVLVV